MTNTQIAAASKIMLGSTEAIKMYIGSTLIWPSGGGGQVVHNYADDYFTIESLQDSNTINITKAKSPANISLSYSTDDGETWTDVTISSNTTFTTINTGDKIMFKGVNTRLASAWDTYYKFNPSKNFKVYGNAMSLLYGDNFASNSEFPSGSNNNFAGLFYGTTTLTDASNLILPATICTSGCYNGMFRSCTNLVNGPKLLPALDVPKDGYSSMFEGCVKLVEGPEILATSVSGTTALNRMFCMNRNSKVTAAMTKSPILRITNPAQYANTYQQLFAGNGSMCEVTILAQNGSASFTNWLANVASSGVIKKPSSLTLGNGASGVPSGWTTEEYTQS